MKIAILGASDNPQRFSYEAQKRLLSQGHEVFPVSRDGREILGVAGFDSILDIPMKDRPIHTVTVYLRPERFAEIAKEVRLLNPSRVIFNPGSESNEIADVFLTAGIEVVEACTLIMLDEGTF